MGRTLLPQSRRGARVLEVGPHGKFHADPHGKILDGLEVLEMVFVYFEVGIRRRNRRWGRKRDGIVAQQLESRCKILVAEPN